MPKGPPDETKLRTGEDGADALSEGMERYPAAADSPRFEHDVPHARAPRMAAKRGGPGGLILGLVVLAAAAGAVWYFFFR
jgi:hypothetical protein